MIIGLSHIIFSTRSALSHIAAFETHGWMLSQRCVDIVSDYRKWPYTFSEPSKHNIYLATGPFPLEIIEHDISGPPTNVILDFDDNSLLYQSSDLLGDYTFFKNGLGLYSIDYRSFSLSNRILSNEAKLKLSSKDDSSESTIYMNGEGVSCLSFYTTNLKQDLDNLSRFTVSMPTDIFPVALASHDVCVGILRSPGGMIIELIQRSKH